MFDPTILHVAPVLDGVSRKQHAFAGNHQPQSHKQPTTTILSQLTYPQPGPNILPALHERRKSINLAVFLNAILRCAQH